jgi:DNA-directed RNA polymerase alpha subunit
MLPDAAKSRHLPLEDLNLSLRIRNALRVGRDIRTVEELCRLGPEEIIRLPGLSSISLRQIEDALATKGHWLGEFRADGSRRLPLAPSS